MNRTEGSKLSGHGDVMTACESVPAVNPLATLRDVTFLNVAFHQTGEICFQELPVYNDVTACCGPVLRAQAGSSA